LANTGTPNPKGLDFYNRLLDNFVANDIAPFPTLYHWDLPQAPQDRGAGQPVLILHGTTQSGTAMLSPTFAGELFGPGEPLDASKYFIVLPDAIGHGKSAKPSDGLRAKFPQYNYDDTVVAQYRLLTEGLGLRRLRLILGNSMGGMQTWIWGVKYPDFMDVLVPMASQPSEMSSGNWMMRRLITDSIRNDPEWNSGNSWS
jgi:homoserine O-acetyltransferase